MRGLVLSLGVSLAMLLAYVGAASAVDDVGYRDFSFSANSVDNPTGEKPQSKLWFNDGTWWASMFNRTVEEYHIYRYDRATHTWSDTGTLIDERNSSKADALWNGSHLYVATAGNGKNNSAHSARILRYSYDAPTKRYSLDPGFPVTGISNGGMEAIVLDRDTTGKLWVTYTQNRKVHVNRSLSTDQTWGTPFVLPVAGASNLNADDISAVGAYDLRTAAPKIGVMWSNQADDAMYFATHTDGDADDVWQASQNTIQGLNYADDHVSLRSLQVDDVSGRVFVAIKTSLNDLPNPDPNAPLIYLQALGQDGNWTNHIFGRVGDNHTRPILMIDEEHRDLYMFATAPCCEGGAIYYKKTALSNISFPEGVGTPFIQSATDTHINNATSTKQNLNSATGLLVQASDDTSQFYVHNFIDLATTAPSCTITGTANAETISGTSGDDVICAGGGKDTINGLGGNDTLKGEAGNDTFLGGVGNDTLDGGIGTDTANFSSSLAPITASLTTNTATGEGSDTLTAIENLVGSSMNDTLTGSEANNNINGGGLGDSLTGMGGADTLNGVGGPDSVNSQDGVNGNDSLNGGAGTDTKVTDATEMSIVGFP